MARSRFFSANDLKKRNLLVYGSVSMFMAEAVEKYNANRHLGMFSGTSRRSRPFYPIKANFFTHTRQNNLWSTETAEKRYTLALEEYRVLLEVMKL